MSVALIVKTEARSLGFERNGHISEDTRLFPNDVSLALDGLAEALVVTRSQTAHRIGMRSVEAGPQVPTRASRIVHRGPSIGHLHSAGLPSQAIDR
jgi:hypothetical protein